MARSPARFTRTEKTENFSVKPLALITGVGPGTGTSIARRFSAAGYRTALLARDESRLNALAAELPDALALPCDVTDPVSLAAAIEQAGPPEVVVHNAVGGAWGTFREIDPAVLERNFQVNVMALLHLARLTTPAMVEAGRGSLIVTGNTSALRGRARFAGFAPTKAAQRILAESMARDLGPQGVHVAYLVIDAVIDVPWARELHADKADDFFIRPDAIAHEVLHLVQQDRSAWSFYAEVRPYHEIW
jgi:NAD(P)-dependent dehydrogenase (short-subunit alcohol dehydrogenase family)